MSAAAQRLEKCRAVDGVHTAWWPLFNATCKQNVLAVGLGQEERRDFFQLGMALGNSKIQMLTLLAPASW